MRRLARDAALIAVTALVVWFARGDAQDVTPVWYGQPFQLVCTQGEIMHADMFYDDFDGTLSLSWHKPSDAINVNVARRMSGYMNFVDCTAYPDLTAP